MDVEYEERTGSYMLVTANRAAFVREAGHDASPRYVDSRKSNWEFNCKARGLTFVHRNHAQGGCVLLDRAFLAIAV